MKTILVIDDDPDLRANLAWMLEKSGYAADEAADGTEAVAKIASKEFDVALIDMVLPGTDGLDLLRELKRAKPRVKAVMITAFATVESAVKAMKAGASDYISKPFTIEELLTLIRRIFEEIRFEKNMGALNMDNALTAIANPIRRRIILMLLDNPGARLMDICREIGIEEHTKVVFHLNMLIESGIVERNKRLYSLTHYGMKTIETLKDAERHLL
ncbi:MAG: response regulator [Deltaproteobacteria bacterium]|nr:response regulator [Deltaproteobacteria bacterium]